MDVSELHKLAFLRVKQMEPQNAGKILGCILLREPDDDEMVQLAYGNDAAVHARITDAKATLSAIFARCSASAAAAHHHHHHHPMGPAAAHRYHHYPAAAAAAAGARHHHHFAAPTAAAAAFGFHYWPESPVPKAAAQAAAEDFSLVDAEGHYALLPPTAPPPPHQQHQSHNGFDDHYAAAAVGGGYYYAAEEAFHNGGGGGGGGGGLPPRAAARRAAANGGLTAPRRPCHYFIKGMCKNGQNCHYSHHYAHHHHHSHHNHHHNHQQHQAVYSSSAAAAGDGFAAGDDGHHGSGGGTPGALEKLELEIIELLHSRHGQPLSIASLPTLYGERYGKGLQAEGYLTESQRQGKAGFSLTRLLSRLSKITIIERPHGQHSVVLAEDAARYTEFRGDRGGGEGEMGSVPASSHQIYLTFPAESTFIEEDVATYFGKFGPVRDVRIPCQERRMFGFVSFQNPETVSNILMKRNPHFICGSRVLVKPYREKSKCIERYPRTCVDKVKPMQFYPTRFVEIDDHPDFYPDEYEPPSRMVRKQLADKRERLIELERKRFAGAVRLDSLPQQFAYFDCSIGDDGVNCLSSGSDSKDEVDQLMDHPLMTPDSLEMVSTSQAPQTQATNNYDDKESNQIELLPESPFASAVPGGNSISTIM